MVRPHGRTSDTAGTSGIIPCRTTSHPLSGSGDPTPRVPARNTFFLSSSLMTSSKDNPPVCTGKEMTLWSSIERRDPFDSRVSQNPSFGGFLPRGDDTREPCMTSASGSFHLVVLVRVSAPIHPGLQSPETVWICSLSGDPGSNHTGHRSRSLPGIFRKIPGRDKVLLCMSANTSQELV